jgi:hypothetical protein
MKSPPILIFFEPCAKCKIIQKKTALLTPGKNSRYSIRCACGYHQLHRNFHDKELLNKFITSSIYEKFEGLHFRTLNRKGISGKTRLCEIMENLGLFFNNKKKEVVIIE